MLVPLSRTLRPPRALAESFDLSLRARRSSRAGSASPLPPCPAARRERRRSYWCLVGSSHQWQCSTRTGRRACRAVRPAHDPVRPALPAYLSDSEQSRRRAWPAGVVGLEIWLALHGCVHMHAALSPEAGRLEELGPMRVGGASSNRHCCAPAHAIGRSHVGRVATCEFATHHAAACSRDGDGAMRAACL